MLRKNKNSYRTRNGIRLIFDGAHFTSEYVFAGIGHENVKRNEKCFKNKSPKCQGGFFLLIFFIFITVITSSVGFSSYTCAIGSRESKVVIRNPVVP